MLSVTDKSRMRSDDRRRYTLSLAEATEFGGVRALAGHRLYNA